MSAADITGLPPLPVGAPPPPPTAAVKAATKLPVQVSVLVDAALARSRDPSPRPRPIENAVAEEDMPAEIARLSQQVEELQKQNAAVRIAYEEEKRAKEEAERQLKVANEFFAVPGKQKVIREESSTLKEDIFASVRKGLTSLIEGRSIDGSNMANGYADTLRDLTLRNQSATQKLGEQRETVAKLGSENESTASVVLHTEKWLDFFRKMNYISLAFPTFVTKVKTVGKALEEVKKNLTFETLKAQMEAFQEAIKLKEELTKKGESSPSDLVYLIQVLTRMCTLRRDSEEKLLGPLPREGDKFFSDCAALLNKLCVEWTPAYEQYQHVVLQLNLLEDQLVLCKPLEKLAKDHEALYKSILDAINQFNAHLRAPNSGRNPVSGQSCHVELTQFYTACKPKLEALAKEWDRLEKLYTVKMTKYGKEKTAIELCTYTNDDADVYNIDPKRSKDLIKTDLLKFNTKLKGQIESQVDVLFKSYQEVTKTSFDYTALVLSWIEPVANGQRQNMTTWAWHWAFGRSVRPSPQAQAPAAPLVDQVEAQDPQSAKK